MGIANEPKWIDICRLPRALGQLAIYVARAAQDGKVQLSESNLRSLTWGTGDISRLFDLATEAEVGEEIECEDADALVAASAESQYLIISVTTGQVAIQSGIEILDQEQVWLIGGAILKAEPNQWILWRSFAGENLPPRILYLPEWREFYA